MANGTTIALLSIGKLRCMNPKRGIVARVGVVLPATSTVSGKTIEFLDNDSQGWKSVVPNIPHTPHEGIDPAAQDLVTGYEMENRDENLHRLVRVVVNYTGEWGIPLEVAQFTIINSFGCNNMVTHPNLVGGVITNELFGVKRVGWAAIDEGSSSWGLTVPEFDVGDWTGSPEPTFPPGAITWKLGFTNKHTVRSRMLRVIVTGCREPGLDTADQYPPWTRLNTMGR